MCGIRLELLSNKVEEAVKELLWIISRHIIGKTKGNCMRFLLVSRHD